MSEPTAYAVSRAGKSLADAIASHVEQAVALERDRFDAELAEIRDEIVALSQRADATGEIDAAIIGPLVAEVAALNDRITRLTQTVASYPPPYDVANIEHSRRVGESWGDLLKRRHGDEQS